MSSPEDEGRTDVRGRTVVWSAGSLAPRPRRRRSAALRWAGLLGAVAVASFSLAYAVHSYVVVPPPPAGPAAPLWLPVQLPPDDSADRGPSSHPTSSRTPEPGDDRDARSAEHGTDHRGTDGRPPTAAGTGTERAVTSGTRPRPSGSSQAARADRSSSVSEPGHRTSGGGSGAPTRSASDDRGSGSGSSGGSGSGSGSSSGSRHGGSGHGGSDDHDSGGSDESRHGGSDRSGQGGHGSDDGDDGDD